MPGTRIKRAEAEAMFADFLKGGTYRGIAEKYGRAVDRVRALASRETWEAKRQESHEEALRQVMAQSAKRKAERIQGIEWIIARLLEQLDKRHEASGRRGLDGLSDAEATKLALEAVREVRKERGEEAASPAVAVNIGVNAPPLYAPAEVAALAAEHERLRIEMAKPVEVKIEEIAKYKSTSDVEGAGRVPQETAADADANVCVHVSHVGSATGFEGEVASAAKEARAPWECPYVFASPECGYRGIASSCDGRLETCKAIGNQARYGGRPMTPEERAANQRPGKNGGTE